MIKLECTNVYGLEAAIRGMRNPMNSWDKSDSCWCYDNDRNKSQCDAFCCDDCFDHFYEIGENDLKRMKSLSKAGTDHRKFMRMITVYADITAPMYWWKEFDTYKVGTVRNSCSTMHKITEKEFTLDDFSHEQLITTELDTNSPHTIRTPVLFTLECIIEELNYCRGKYLETKDNVWWWQMIQLLPSSYNQRATVMLNYEVLANMYHSRKNHKLDEWRAFCDAVLLLPYFEAICVDTEEVTI